ncbi:MAG TPA: BrnA antitoxin family protein [Allosphingosinicella sp.]|nr:BrnA antitoxin family protein [Allosphingosinicella sp.]
MSKKGISGTSRVAEEGAPFLPDPYDEIPEADDTFFERAAVVRGGKVIREGTGTLTNRGRPPLPEGTRKQLVSVRLSPDILWWLRSTGPGWQSRMEEMLRERMEAALAARASAPPP